MTIQEIAQSICNTAGDYRRGELAPPTVQHVQRWIEQFEPAVRLPLLSELDHVLKATYLSRDQISNFLSNLISNEELTGGDPCGFWQRAHFLDIQANGHSQHEMLGLFDALLRNECGFGIAECGRPGGAYIYIDDIVFSGNRARGDLIPWIENDAPANAEVHVIALALHTGSEWVFRVPITAAIKESGKGISFRKWRAVEIENQKQNRNTSAVLWPASLPNDEILAAYVAAQRYPPKLRAPGHDADPPIFSSEQSRSLLEREMLMAGMRIRGFSRNPNQSVRPLGFGPFGLGFGSTFVTYRNCPNNAPLALWWGNPNAHPNHPFSKWYPLFPRKTYDRD